MQQANPSITQSTYQAAANVKLNQEPKSLTVVLMDTTAGHTAAISFDGVTDALVLSGGILQSYKFEHRIISTAKDGTLSIWIKASNTANVQIIAEQ